MAATCDLSDELVRECLLRVPYHSHEKVKSVCGRWEAMLSSPKFYEDRKISGTTDHMICLITRNLRDYINDDVITVYDHAAGTWKNLPRDIDPEYPGIPFSCAFVTVNRKLFLIGGLHPRPSGCFQTVYIYDFLSAQWSRGADMPTVRRLFACAAISSTGRIYVAGGLDGMNKPLRTAACYDVEHDRWEVLPPMTEERVGCLGVVMENKFIVICGSVAGSAEVFDPTARTWTRWENMWSLNARLPHCSEVTTSSSGELFSFVHDPVMKYDRYENVWIAVGSFPRHAKRHDTFTNATKWHDWIFVTTNFICYLFHPSTGQSITVRDDGISYFRSVTTLEI